MKFYRRDLISQSNESIMVNESLSFDLSDFKGNLSGLRDLKNVSIFGKILFDLSLDRIFTDLMIKGEMVVGCAITNEDVTVPFETPFDDVYSFVSVNDPEEDIIEVKTDFVDLSYGIFQSILFEVPIKVVKPGLKDYPKGNGWEVLKEEDFDQREKPIDPRLEKLKEFIVK